MSLDPRSVIQSTFDASNAGEIHFGQVITQLMGVGVESYHVDYRTARATYFLANGENFAFEFALPEAPIADAFDQDGVRAAILGAQQGRVMYPEFKLLTQRAGCVGYTVWIAGRHVSYAGRRGELHVERFPD
ncbi:uncharacterized protein YbcV (DUF1398 family) [Comamonas odontotermitis]|uniref:Uncharacterized protein YbcV (DUF1398 family) n=1 Tax=Comamonas odontotermitis TaxID=379895 RepID=A0ABR6RD17_9BURK|nr:DUF1398 family protein [Comamonas odontotermitis]MBB6577035.1 uncharacterized protein YbcV (DUF1398 family) [Comamonas odontotermitis]